MVIEVIEEYLVKCTVGSTAVSFEGEDKMSVSCSLFSLKTMLWILPFSHIAVKIKHNLM